MDKFTKTTEIDISAMTEMEDETPKKSNVGNVIAMICCLIFAIIIWLFVMEIDTSEKTRAYNDISISVIGNEGYVVSGNKTVDVVLKGISKELADVDRDDIQAILDFSEINNIFVGEEHEYSVKIECVEAGESIKCDPVTVKLTINETK